jgi:hypothetical protein
VAAYRIDPAQSELRLLVYRSGPMALLGHNHVIVNRALTGWVGLANKPADSSFSLQIPAAGFVIDEAVLRREEGADFPGEIDDDAKSGTQQNMLSAALLNAAQYPVITVSSLDVQSLQSVESAEPEPALMTTMAVNVAGHAAKIVGHFGLERGSGRLVATGTITLRQSAIGLIPFSVMMGALQVQDELRLKFKIVALTAQKVAGLNAR